MVAKGFSQRPGIDFTQVFAPTFRPAALRLIAAIAGIEDMELRSVDVTGAFLNGELDEVIYMKMPEGFDQGEPGQVLKLNKSLYGLKQSARQWNKKLHSVLTQMGFKRLESDRSIYIYVKGEVKILVPVYVDDITFASKSKKAIDDTVAEFAKHFKIRDLGDTKFLLGVEVIRDRENRTIALSQRQYIIDMLERYGMSDCNPVSTPMQPNLKLSKAMGPQTPDEEEYMSKVPYLNAVGSLQYLATMTRPDIAYAVSTLARFNCKPGPSHWHAVKHLLRYCKATMDHKLTYSAQSPSELSPERSKLDFTTYCDASHGDCLDTGRSTGGYVTMIAGGAIGYEF